jgi:hypothetical protein
LYNLETFLVEITGRPTSMIMDLEMTVSEEGLLSESETQLTELGQRLLPHALGTPRNQQSGTAQHSLSTYFSRRVHVSRISRRISATLYAGGLSTSWAQFQVDVRSVESEIEALTNSVTRPSHNLDRAWLLGNRHELELVMSIHSLQMTLYRPFLCDWEGKIRDESSRSRDFNQSKAEAAIAAARSMLNLLFSVDSLKTLPLVFPCWSTLHYICQAGAILLLELSMHAIHLPLEAAEMLRVLHRVLIYMNAMSTSSYSATKAQGIFECFLQEIESRMGTGSSF